MTRVLCGPRLWSFPGLAQILDVFSPLELTTSTLPGAVDFTVALRGLIEGVLRDLGCSIDGCSDQMPRALFNAIFSALFQFVDLRLQGRVHRVLVIFTGAFYESQGIFFIDGQRAKEYQAFYHKKTPYVYPPRLVENLVVMMLHLNAAMLSRYESIGVWELVDQGPVGTCFSRLCHRTKILLAFYESEFPLDLLSLLFLFIMFLPIASISILPLCLHHRLGVTSSAVTAGSLQKVSKSLTEVSRLLWNHPRIFNGVPLSDFKQLFSFGPYVNKTAQSPLPADSLVQGEAWNDSLREHNQLIPRESSPTSSLLSTSSGTLSFVLAPSERSQSVETSYGSSEALSDSGSSISAFDKNVSGKRKVDQASGDVFVDDLDDLCDFGAGVKIYDVNGPCVRRKLDFSPSLSPFDDDTYDRLMAACGSPIGDCGAPIDPIDSKASSSDSGGVFCLHY